MSVALPARRSRSFATPIAVGAPRSSRVIAATSMRTCPFALTAIASRAPSLLTAIAVI
jgi:hypothetical protein